VFRSSCFSPTFLAPSLRLVSTLALGFVALTMALPRLAADLVFATWQGGAEGAWSDATNWSPSAAFPNNGNLGNTYFASISDATVSLSGTVSLDGLSLSGASISGSGTLGTGLGAFTVAGASELQAGVALVVGGPFGFASSAATLTNRGTVQFNASGASSYSTSTATLTNAVGGVIRFNPSAGTSIGSYDTSPFHLANAGTIRADNGAANYIHAPITQSSGGLIRATDNTVLYVARSSTLGGTLHADAGSWLSLTGYDQTHTLDQTAITGSGNVIAGFTHITGALGSGVLRLDYATITGGLVNESEGTLLWGSGTRFGSSEDTLINRGTLQFDAWTSSYSASTATLTNAAGGVIRFNPSTSTSIGSPDTSPFHLANAGTIRADNGAANYIHAPITQSSGGSIRATDNTVLYVARSSTLGGTLHADAGSWLSLTGYDQTHTLDQTAITGAGNVIAGFTHITGALGSGVLRLDYATITGELVNESEGTLLWGSGTRFGSSEDTLINRGTLQFDAWTSAYSASTATLTNAAGGVIRFNPSTSTSIGSPDTSPFHLANAGTIRADNGTVNYIHAPITQSSGGSIRATDNTVLYVARSSTLGGTLHADAGSWLSLTGYDQTHTLDQTAITGSGNVIAGFTHITGALGSGVLRLDYATITGELVNESEGTLLWGSGTRFGSSEDTLINRGTLQFDAWTSAYSASTATLTNAVGGVIRFNPSTGTSIGSPDTSPFHLANAGTIRADNGAANYIHAPMTNTGLVRVTTGSQLYLMNGFVQTAGETRIEGAWLAAAYGQALVFEGGTLRASGLIAADLSITDTAVEIGLGNSAASLNVWGDVALLTGSVVSFDLNGTTQADGYDYWAVGGDLSLGGELRVRLDPAFAALIDSSQEFTVITATSIGGAFSNVVSGSRLELPDIGSFLVTISGTDVKLSDFSAVPEPGSAGVLAGAAVFLSVCVCRRRRRAACRSSV
jgi:hypothetical protein